MWRHLAFGLSIVLITTGHGLGLSVEKPDNDFTFVDEAEIVENLGQLIGKAEEFETRLRKHEDISDTIVSKSDAMDHKLDSMATTLKDVVDTLENHLLKIEGMAKRLSSLEENSSLHTNRDFNPIQEFIFEPAKYHVEEAEAENNEPKVTEVTKDEVETDVTEEPIVVEDAKFNEETDVTEEPGDAELVNKKK